MSAFFLQVRVWKGEIFQIIDGPLKSHYGEEDKVESCWNSARLKVFWTHSEDVARGTRGLAPV